MNLPSTFNSKYVRCKRQPNKLYRMYWIGTSHEIFPGMTFATPSIAKAYLQEQITQQHQEHTQHDMAR